MNLYLQFGYGMMSHAKELINEWGDGGVILSPRDLNEAQLIRTAQDVSKVGGEVLLDPQCFLHDADWHTLVEHNYFKLFQSHATDAFLGGPATSSLLQKIYDLGNSLGVKRHILPSLLANPISDDWFAIQENIISEAESIFPKGGKIVTLALSTEAICAEDQIEAVVERASDWDVDGFYVIAETPSAYLVDDPNWMANLLILTSGLKLLGKPVIVGYCSHQMLALASANVDIICSGTWLNVRAFPQEKFYSSQKDEISRRAVWYYCPNSLSEYKLPMLDIAQRQGVLTELAIDAILGSNYSDPLFKGPAPSSVNWGEQNAFRHYLTCLRHQAHQSSRATFSETLDSYLKSLDSAEKFSKNLRSNGVLGGDRDFSQYFDINRSAMVVFSSARKQRLIRSWKSSPTPHL